MKWKRRVQKLGRIQIPTAYLKDHGIKEGDAVTIEETKNGLRLFIKSKR